MLTSELLSGLLEGEGQRLWEFVVIPYEIQELLGLLLHSVWP